MKTIQHSMKEHKKKHHNNTLLGIRSLKTESCHDANLIVTCDTGGRRCHEWLLR